MWFMFYLFFKICVLIFRFLIRTRTTKQWLAYQQCTRTIVEGRRVGGKICGNSQEATVTAALHATITTARVLYRKCADRGNGGRSCGEGTARQVSPTSSLDQFCQNFINIPGDVYLLNLSAPSLVSKSLCSGPSDSPVCSTIGTRTLLTLLILCLVGLKFTVSS